MRNYHFKLLNDFFFFITNFMFTSLITYDIKFTIITFLVRFNSLNIWFRSNWIEIIRAKLKKFSWTNLFFWKNLKNPLKSKTYHNDQKQNFNYNDFYVSKSNYFAFKSIEKWPSWEKNILNIFNYSLKSYWFVPKKYP